MGAQSVNFFSIIRWFVYSQYAFTQNQHENETKPAILRVVKGAAAQFSQIITLYGVDEIRVVQRFQNHYFLS